MGGYFSLHQEPTYNHINNNNEGHLHVERSNKSLEGCRPVVSQLRKLSSIEVDPDDEIYLPSANSQAIKKKHKNSKVVRKTGLDYLMSSEQLSSGVKQYEIDIKSLQIGSLCVPRYEFDNEDSFGRIVRNGLVQGLYLTSESSCVLVKECDPASKSENEPQYAWKSFLREINTLVWLGWHPNVVTFLGIAAGDVHENELYLICESCKTGNLRDYLRKQSRKSGRIQELTHDVQVAGGFGSTTNLASSTQKFGSREHLYSVKHDEELNTLTSKWILEICTAMEFLCSRRVVYVQLSASSIQLTENLTAKLGNFTLARSLKSDEDHFIFREHIPLPWRWLAPESFDQFKYSTETDVWGFGILVWEILSLGQQPYTGMNWSTAFVGHLREGLRLPQLPSISFPLYNFLEACWDLDPERRPTFTEAMAKLSPILDANVFQNSDNSEQE